MGEAGYPRDWATFDPRVASETIALVKSELQKDHKDHGSVNVLKRKLDEYLKEQRILAKCAAIVYRDIGKEKYLLDVPLSVRIPEDYILLSKTKVRNFALFPLDQWPLLDAGAEGNGKKFGNRGGKAASLR